MPYCSKCDTLVPESAAFCQRCGQAQSVSTAPTEQSSLSPNTAALLSYVLGWLSGLIFFLVDKRPYVRFHAAQSIITFGGLHIVRALLGMVFDVGWWFGGMRHMGRMWPAWPILRLLATVTCVLWIVLMVKAHQGQKYKLPIAGGLAEDWASNLRLQVGGHRYELRQTLTELEQKLDPADFLRIHRSTIVNVRRIKEIQAWFHGHHRVLLVDGKELRMSRYQYEAAKKLGLT